MLLLHTAGGDGHVLFGMDWLELVTLVAVLGIFAGACWAWYAGARMQKAQAARREGPDQPDGPPPL